MNTANSTRTVWVDTHRVTLAEYEADVRYPLETLSQGRDATNRVPPFSMLAGKPDEFSEADGAFRATVWKVIAVALIAGWSAFAAGVIAGVQP